MTAAILDRITHHARRMLALNRGSKSDRRKGSNLDQRKQGESFATSSTFLQSKPLRLGLVCRHLRKVLGQNIFR